MKLPGLLSASRVELCMGTDAAVPELDVTLVCIPLLRWCYTRCSGIEAMGWLWVDCVRQQDQRFKGWRWFNFVVSCVGVHFRTLLTVVVLPARSLMTATPQDHTCHDCGWSWIPSLSFVHVATSTSETARLLSVWTVQL